VKNDGIDVYAIKGENRKTYYRHILSALAVSPHMTMDDGRTWYRWSTPRRRGT